MFCINIILEDEGESYVWSFAALAVLMILTAVLYVIFGRQITVCIQYNNNRIKSLVVYYYLGDTIKAQKTVDLDDVYSMEPVHFSLIDGNLSEEYYCDSIRIEFKAVYKGQKFNDLCLTDIKFYEGTLE